MVTETYLGATEASLAGHGIAPRLPAHDRAVRIGRRPAGRTPRPREEEHHEEPQRNHRPVLRGRRGVVVFVAGALVLVLGVTGVHAALGGRTVASPVTHPSPTARSTRPRRVARWTSRAAPAYADGRADTDRRAHADRSERAGRRRLPDVRPRASRSKARRSPSTCSRPSSGRTRTRRRSRTALPGRTCGTTPSTSATRTRCCGRSRSLLTSSIKLIGVCEAPSRTVGLTELREETTPFTEHLLLRRHGRRVAPSRASRQLVAIAGC